MSPKGSGWILTAKNLGCWWHIQPTKMLYQPKIVGYWPKEWARILTQEKGCQPIKQHGFLCRKECCQIPFGDGYCSVSQLQSLPFQYSFVRTSTTWPGLLGSFKNPWETPTCSIQSDTGELRSNAIVVKSLAWRLHQDMGNAWWMVNSWWCEWLMISEWLVDPTSYDVVNPIIMLSWA